MSRSAFGILFMLAAAAAASPAHAQFAITSFVIAGGGGDCGGGGAVSFTLSGTIGQADAGPVMTAGGFSLAGGFWGGGVAGPVCGTADFDCDGDIGTDADIVAFFRCLSGTCPPPPCPNSADFNGDGDLGTDADIEAFFSVLGGGPC